MATKGMDSVFISVSNLEDSLAFFRDFVGMKVVADETLEPDRIQQLWNLPRETQARAVFLKSELGSTLLEVIEFKPHSGRVIKEGAEARYYGLYDVAFQVKNMDAIYRDLTAKGFAFLTPPIQYQPVFIPFPVKQVFFLGPGNVPLTLIELMAPQEQDAQEYRPNKLNIELMASQEQEAQGYHFNKLNDSAQIVESIDEAIKFYVDILGLDLMDQVTVPEGFLDELLGLPPNTGLKLAFVNRKDTDALLLEFVQPSVKGKSPAAAARPPNLGLFMISFEVDNLASLTEKFEKEGITILSGPVELHTKVHGKMRAITVEGPGGAMIELFER